VAIQLYAGLINAAGQMENPQVQAMAHTRQMGPGRHLFTGNIESKTSGRQGFVLLIVPGHPDLATPFEPGLITWN